MGDVPYQLFGVFGLEDQAAIDEDLLAAGGEGLQLITGNQVNLHRLGVEPGGPEDRVGLLVENMLDLRVADNRDALIVIGRPGRADRRENEARHGQDRATRANPFQRSVKAQAT